MHLVEDYCIKMGREALEGLHVSPKPVAIRQQENQQSDHFPSRYTAFFIELFFFLRILSQLICPALLRRGRTNRNGIGSNTLSPFRKHVRSSIQPSSHFQRTSLSCCHHDRPSLFYPDTISSQPLTLAHFPLSSIASAAPPIASVDVNNI